MWRNQRGSIKAAAKEASKVGLPLIGFETPLRSRDFSDAGSLQAICLPEAEEDVAVE